MTPRARVIVTTAGSPSGIAATAKLTAVRNMMPNGSPRRIPRTNTTATIPRESHSKTRPRCSKPALERRLTSFCLGGGLDQVGAIPTQFCLASCFNHQRTGLPGHGDRSHEDEIVRGRPGGPPPERLCSRRFHNGVGFTGQRRFLRLQTGRIDQTATRPECDLRLPLE